MKTTRIYSMTKNISLLALAIAMIFSISSCATKTKFLASPVVPAAEGIVSVKQDNNKNYNIGISIRNLAEPTRLQPAKNMYVVWMEGDDNETKNIGQIKSSHSMISKTLKGSFETVSAVRPKKVFITAENDPAIQYPNYSDIILTTDYLKQK